MTKATPPTLAAGALLWRNVEGDAIEIALVHRPRYDDWTLPKGKLEAGEHLIECAAREVREETGAIARFGPLLGQVSYDVEGEPKNVTYWAARAVEMHEPTAESDEIGRVQWLSPGAARAVLTYGHDIEVLNSFLKIGTGTLPIVLLRHAKAVKRSDWDGDDDDDRPLDSRGEIQAQRLRSTLRAYGPLEIHSSDANRCQQTASLLSDKFAAPIITESSLSEYSYKRDSEAALSRIKQLLQLERPLVICSHRPVLPHLARALLENTHLDTPTASLEPAAAWVIHARGGVVIAIDYLSAPE
ncbi:MAG TPA: NUDIX hydrolase [Candidatus Nanopelagicaceae bacterium]|nr:NUDIX hydrolase [Candidatus Nanopelagicaceae bacterium]